MPATHARRSRVSYVDCPVCGSPDTRKTTQIESGEEISLMYCTNHACGSNGGTNFDAVPVHDNAEAVLEIVNRLARGVARMTKRQFCESLKRSIGATEDYADGCWVAFQDNPAAYLANRNPQTQSLGLLRDVLSAR